jgi:hypothetical protein
MNIYTDTAATPVLTKGKKTTKEDDTKAQSLKQAVKHGANTALQAKAQRAAKLSETIRNDPSSEREVSIAPSSDSDSQADQSVETGHSQTNSGASEEDSGTSLEAKLNSLRI